MNKEILKTLCEVEFENAISVKNFLSKDSSCYLELKFNVKRKKTFYISGVVMIYLNKDSNLSDDFYLVENIKTHVDKKEIGDFCLEQFIEGFNIEFQSFFKFIHGNFKKMSITLNDFLCGKLGKNKEITVDNSDFSNEHIFLNIDESDEIFYSIYYNLDKEYISDINVSLKFLKEMFIFEFKDDNFLISDLYEMNYTFPKSNFPKKIRLKCLFL